jgi:2,4-dienoyl-CoA reductase-like NADH-dependent reductase (Old Yellow Enzyme family)/thioredoxin reductase
LFDRLFSPLEIGPVTLRNRIQITPHEQEYLSNGLVTNTLIDYYVERAKGGAGLLEVSEIFVRPPTGIHWLPEWTYDNPRRFPFISGPEIILGLRQLTDEVHKHGGKTFIEVSAWTMLYGPVSSMPYENGSQLKEIRTEDIPTIIEDYCKAAKVAKDSGFDGIDFHGSHGSLVEHFYSPLLNRRADVYGGSFENRMRFLLELFTSARQEIGDNVAIGMRLCGDEKTDGGVTPEESSRIAGVLDGVLDFINVDSGSYSYFEALDNCANETQPLYANPGYGVYMAESVKKAVKKTKIGTVGRIADPLLADTILLKGQADYVGMTRALIADPELPNKARENRLDEIRPCIGTLQDCWGRSAAHSWPMRCTVNPTVGREGERGSGKLCPAETRKKLLIIGAGPAGLEAARVASERGHEVVIYEKGSRIGGLLNLAKKIPGRSDIGALVAWYEVQLRKKHYVRIQLHLEVTSREEAEYLVEEEKPDAVVVATGSTPIRSGLQMLNFREISGWDLPHVRVIDDILESDEEITGRVVVADSTTFIEGPGIAEWLARKGSSVTLVSPHARISPELADYNQSIQVLKRLSNSNVRTRTFCWIRQISERSITLVDLISGSEEELETDYVVLNTGRKQNSLTSEYFKGLKQEVYEIGDCYFAGGKIRAAIEAGYKLGSSI